MSYGNQDSMEAGITTGTGEYIGRCGKKVLQLEI
jgi:hypothetical protein